MSTNPDGTVADADRRSVRRWLRSESVSVQVLLPCDDGSCPAQVVDTRTVDVSARGMRLLVGEALEAGRIFDFCVELGDHPRRFLLTGETRWCRRQADQPRYELGIEIREGEGTDYLAWAEMIMSVGRCDDGEDGPAAR